MIALQRMSALRNLLMRDALIRGESTLSSGLKSNYYFDCRAVTLTAEGSYLIANIVLDIVEEMGSIVDVIGGPPRGADAIAVAVATQSHLRHRPIDAFMLREQAKSHGTRKDIEGASVEGRNVLIVEDVVSTGASVRWAIERVEEKGGIVQAVISLIDRGGYVGDYLYTALFKHINGDLV